ncbi:MAG TPA: hypothetical protein VFA30_09225 [Gaiellaceae bacterium]|nr:hypothetical protein [Gaiellaceae bacterium]
MAVLTGVACAMYLWTKAPLYNPRATIDPWLYTALWTNFDQTFHAFVHTYYASRIPWIVPGYVANLLFAPRTASLVVHTIFFFVGGLAAYLTCRRFVSARMAAVAYVATIGSQMYFDGQRWDYEEGAVLTYSALAALFVTLRPRSWGLRYAALALAGFFAAALVTTQLLDAVLLLGFPFLYAAASSVPTPRELARDLGAFAGGAALLTVACGTFAEANGGRFLFFMPQISVALSQSGEANQQDPHVWIPQEPYFFAPLFVLVIVALVSLTTRRSARPSASKLMLASAGWCGLVYAVLCLWEFLGSGFFFEYVWYFSAFVVPMSLALAGASQAVCDRIGRPVAAWAALCLAGLAVFVPLVWIYGSDNVSRVAVNSSTTEYAVFTGGMIVALASAALGSVHRLRWAALGAAAVSLFSVTYALDASFGTWVEGQSDPTTGSLYDVGMQEVAYLRSAGFDKPTGLPRFWYNAGDGLPGALQSLQSLYYYSYTYVGVSMPKIDDDFRNRMKIFGYPSTLVLLCAAPTCEGGPAALRRAGYRTRLADAKFLQSGALRVWIRVYDLQRS